MLAFRAIFLAFMTWLLVIALPGHKRGAITLGPRSGDSCCAVEPAPTVASCCAPRHEHATKQREPTQKDIANCAVCFWAAGLLTTPPFVFDFSHVERAFEQARLYHAQVERLAIRLQRYGRDPPAHLPDVVVV